MTLIFYLTMSGLINAPDNAQKLTKNTQECVNITFKRQPSIQRQL